jgi:hypothetical protein
MRGWRYLTGYTEYEKKSPYAFLDDLPAALGHIGITRFPHFNSGVFFFRKSETADKIFQISRDIYAEASTLGFKSYKNAPLADEPVLAIAMEKLGVPMHEWDNVDGQETAIGMNDKYSINVLGGRSLYVKNGINVEPAIIHYNVGAQKGFTYLREMARTEMEDRKLPTQLSSLIALRQYGPYVLRRVRNALRRRIKAALGRTPRSYD